MSEPSVTPRPEWNTGKGDHDVPFRFGRHPTAYLHVREFAQLLLLRGRIADRTVLRYRRGDSTQPEA